MKWVLIILGFITIFTLFVWYAITMKKELKKEQDDFENANDSSIKENLND